MNDQDRYINQNELRVIGMSRSGNHAIVQWIMTQTPGRTCFLNCTEGKSNPYLTARVMDDGTVCRANYQEFDPERERRGELSAKDWLIYSHEDGFLGRSCSAEFERAHDRWVGRSRRRFDLLILRDPFNLFASRRKCLWGFLTPRTTIQIWKQHAREFLGRTRRLRHNPVLISYNRWRRDRDYRRQVADRLGLRFTDSGIRRVVSCNGGSSFDGLEFDGRADQMKVLERWKHYVGDADFQRMFDEEVFDLSERIFGRFPGTETLLEPVAGRGRNRMPIRQMAAAITGQPDAMAAS